ncbi:MAG: hypothetical protein Kow00124_03620 [Anaerolineae bacterium]
MGDNTLIIVMPIVALVLASLSVGALWLWWQMSGDKSQEEQEEGQADPAAPEAAPGGTPPEEGLGDLTVGQIVGKLTQSVGGLMPRRAAAEPAAPQIASALPPDGMVEIMRLFRDLADGSLIVQIEGRQYRSLREIDDPQIGRRFLGNARALAQFARLDRLGAADETPQAEEAAAVQPPFPEEAPEVPDRPAAVPPGVTPPPAEEGRSHGGLFRRAEPAPAEPEEPRTMADEIEELLQFRLALSPQLRERSIHIRSTAAGGARIEVDGRFFDSVEHVSDESVRMFIQSVIREWEARR